MKKTRPISCKQLFYQAVSDWFGKEVQTGYTVTYVWMANQFGHFGLGFLFTFIIVWIVKSVNPEIGPVSHLLWIPFSQLLFWIIKETYDYFDALKEIRKNKNFDPNKLDIALDALTAVFFISFGIIISYLSLFELYYSLIAFVCILIIGMFPSRYWLYRKMCFQQAGFPYQYRLSSFDVEIDEEKRTQIENFIDLDDNSWEHLLIFGKRKMRKTCLATGIGTELAFNKGTARYTTFFKFVQFEKETKKVTKEDGRILWNWNKVQILIIDDVNPTSENTELITPTEVKKSIENFSSEVQEDLLNRKTVWVLGLCGSEKNDCNEWRDMFSKVLKTDTDKIGIIKLVKLVEKP